MRCKSAHASFSVTRQPLPPLYIRPETFGARAAFRFSSATSSTYVKSRDCLPSPKIVGGLRSRIARMNNESTPEYGLDGSWRGPYTLKYRMETVSRPKTPEKMLA